jgi:hypothetical protein
MTMPPPPQDVVLGVPMRCAAGARRVAAGLLIPCGIGYACGGLTETSKATDGGMAGTSGRQSVAAGASSQTDAGDGGPRYDAAGCDLDALVCPPLQDSGCCPTGWSISSASSAQVTDCSLEVNFVPQDWSAIAVYVDCVPVPYASYEGASDSWTGYYSPSRIVFGGNVCSRLRARSDLAIAVIVFSAGFYCW